MSEEFPELETQIAGWQAPAKDLRGVVRRGRRLSLIRRGGAAALCIVLLLAGVFAYRSWERAPELQPAGNSFDLVRAAGELNGVTLQRAEPDDSWSLPADQRDLQDWPTLLPEGPIPVLVTSSGLGSGMEERKAWANFIDGWTPGPIIDDNNSFLPRVYLTLKFMDGGQAHLPVAPPYEDWANDGPDSRVTSTYEPWGLWADLEWDGVALEHPANWRRLAAGYNKSGELTEDTTLTITNASNNEAGVVDSTITEFDVTNVPSDAVVVRVGQPQKVVSGVTEGAESIDYAGNRSGLNYVEGRPVWHWIGVDASAEEEAALERILASLDVAEAEMSFTRFAFSLAQGEWNGTLELDHDEGSACLSLSAEFSEAHLHRVGETEELLVWPSDIEEGGLHFCVFNAPPEVFGPVAAGPIAFEIEVHGGVLHGERGALRELMGESPRDVPTDTGERSLARWELEEPVDEKTTELEISVQEIACASARELKEEQIQIDVEYFRDRITILATADPLPPGGHRCPGNPPITVTVQLAEPVGDRELVDAGASLTP